MGYVAFGAVSLQSFGTGVVLTVSMEAAAGSAFLWARQIPAALLMQSGWPSWCLSCKSHPNSLSFVVFAGKSRVSSDFEGSADFSGLRASLGWRLLGLSVSDIPKIRWMLQCSILFRNGNLREYGNIWKPKRKLSSLLVPIIAESCSASPSPHQYVFVTLHLNSDGPKSAASWL